MAISKVNSAWGWTSEDVELTDYSKFIERDPFSFVFKTVVQHVPNSVCLIYVAVRNWRI